MKKTLLALAALTGLLAGCQGSAAPADPPASQDALTTDTEPTTADAEPSTGGPPDDVEDTSAPPETEAEGPPELPEEAKEDSEAGAEAFALHYIEMINYTGRYPEVGLLEPFASETCKSCANHEDSVAYMVEHGETMEKDGLDVGTSVSLHQPADSEALVRVPITQVPQPVLGPEQEITDEIDKIDATMVFDLEWQQDHWIIREITIDMGKQ
ncbi:DUF6318 family protein [Ornithinimicrobium cavernae]|uniref:DUF6318 family protein n=1 Tax=Ornithinimicrobium cavernae TaxID=2666047 RepID=UPI000D688584|nr:DUF6318 family protein [Ornithinimicrobium cavernae]